MAKNIVLFIDGTGQNGRRDGTQKTNVWQLYDAARRGQGPPSIVRGVPVAAPGDSQICHYINGVGTDREDGKHERHKEAVGFGTAERIREAYLFLALNYDAAAEDNVYLFGFSRGAFAVRALAGFVGLVGVLLADLAADEEARRDMIANAYALYERRVTGQRSYMASVLQQLSTIDRERFGRYTEDNPPPPIDIHFIGVWDTVRALGSELLPFDPVRAWTSHHDRPELPAHVSHARHALAIHETRPEFEPTLWTQWAEIATADRKKQTLEQVWFPGDHTDIGGGHDDGDREHSDVTLEWMAAEAGKHGLAYDATLLPFGKTRPATGAVHYTAMFLRLAPRKALSTLTAPPGQPQLLRSFRMHDATCEHLLRPTSTEFKTLSPDMEKWKRWRILDLSDRVLLDQVDTRALDMHLELALVHGQSIAGRSRQDVNVAPDSDGWAKDVVLADARACAATIAPFVADPEAGDFAAIATTLRLFLVCGRESEVEASLTRTTHGVVASLQPDPCLKPARERARKWQQRLGELRALLAGGSAAHVDELLRQMKRELFTADARCFKPGKPTLRPSHKGDPQ